jgi:hypothetical protein
VPSALGVDARGGCRDGGPAALHDAGRRPFTPIAEVMDPAIYHATWVATLWTSVILLAALLTIRMFSPRGEFTECK